MKYQQWSIPELPAGAVDRLTGAGYPYLVSSVLASRGITTPEEAAAFLERDRDLPYSPFLMKDMDKAAQRVSRALAGGEKIAVFGDYDVDGITATVILVDYLLSRGGDVVHYIPRRIEDGYGLSCDAIEGLRKGGATLLVTVDCGITGVVEVAFARSVGMDVVVTDQGIAVNPRRPDVKEKLEKAGLHVFTIEQLQKRAEKLVGVPDPIRYKDRIVGVVMYRDNTIIDVIRQIDEDV